MSATDLRLARSKVCGAPLATRLTLVVPLLPFPRPPDAQLGGGGPLIDLRLLALDGAAYVHSGVVQAGI